MVASFKGICMSDPIFDELAKYIEKSYPNACILYIDEVINDDLRILYEKRKAALIEKRGKDNISEKILFHGTKAHAIDSIAENGFLKKYNKVSAFGLGTYFSTTATYSTDYSDKDNTDVSYMFVCDLLVGICETINGPVPIDTTKYDNSVNKNNPTIYVSPYDDGCFPKYLIAFYKNI